MQSNRRVLSGLGPYRGEADLVCRVYGALFSHQHGASILGGWIGMGEGIVFDGEPRIDWNPIRDAIPRGHKGGPIWLGYSSLCAALGLPSPADLGLTAVHPRHPQNWPRTPAHRILAQIAGTQIDAASPLRSNSQTCLALIESNDSVLGEAKPGGRNQVQRQYALALGFQPLTGVQIRLVFVGLDRDRLAGDVAGQLGHTQLHDGSVVGEGVREHIRAAWKASAIRVLIANWRGLAVRIRAEETLTPLVSDTQRVVSMVSETCPVAGLEGLPTAMRIAQWRPAKCLMRSTLLSG